MRQFGLIGYPLGHSFSKKYFTQKFEDEGWSGCSYQNFPIPSIEVLRAMLKAIPCWRVSMLPYPIKNR